MLPLGVHSNQFCRALCWIYQGGLRNHLVWLCQGNRRWDSKFSTSVAGELVIAGFVWPVDDVINIHMAFGSKKVPQEGIAQEGHGPSQMLP